MSPDRYYVEDHVNGTLKANGKDGFPRTDRQPLVVAALTASNDPSRSPQAQEVTRQYEAMSAAGVGVRRLTPVECERLQGLPDGWTDLGGTADSRRYSAVGDAVTANVAEWIGWRLAAVSEETR